MYPAHRGIPGAAPGPQPGSRLAELLEQVRQEFEAQACFPTPRDRPSRLNADLTSPPPQAGRSNDHEHQRKWPAGTVGNVE